MVVLVVVMVMVASASLYLVQGSVSSHGHDRCKTPWVVAIVGGGRALHERVQLVEAFSDAFLDSPLVADELLCQRTQLAGPLRRGEASEA